MGFLRKVLGGSPGTKPHPAPGPSGGPSAAADTGSMGDDEAARDRELLRAEAVRLSDDLIVRQMRYADRSWTPPAQGGPRRADDGEGEDG